MLSVSAAEDRLVHAHIGHALARRYGGDHLQLDDAGHYALVGEPGWEKSRRPDHCLARPTPTTDIAAMKIVTTHPIIDSVLDRHRSSLGTSLQTYRNHVYRSLNYQELLLDTSVPDLVALAWALHDLGIWTANAFDYLRPSADLASAQASEFGITDIEYVRTIVTEHHKLRPAHDHLSETFRIADRIDVSRGLLHRPISRSNVKTIAAELPYLGFHPLLARGLTSYAVRHPTRPLPMLHW
jgi:hypothetical protein